MSFASGLSNLGAMYNGANTAYTNAEDRRRAQVQQDLMQQVQRQALQQNQQAFQLKQQELVRDRQAAQAGMNGMFGQPGGIPGAQPGQPQSGVPQNVPMPGAQPMPQFNQNNGAAIMRPPGVGSFPGQPGPPQQMPPSAPMGQPPMGQPGARPQAGGGMTRQQLADNIRAQLGPDADPQTFLAAMQKMEPMLRADESAAFREETIGLRERLADMTVRLDEKKLEGSGEDKTAARELDNMVLKAGGNPKGMTADQKNDFVGKFFQGQNKISADNKTKLSGPQQRMAEASDDVNLISSNIKRILEANPKAAGIWGKYNTFTGKVANFFGHPEKADAQAANELAEQFEELKNALGVAGTYGGVGGAAASKSWKEQLDAKGWGTNAQTLTDMLNAMQGKITTLQKVAGEGDQEHIDDVIDRWNK